MKKLAALTALFLCAAFTFAFTQNDIRVFTLENGMTLYFLQDTTTATVRMELNIKAGVTASESADETSLLTLCAKLSGLELTPDVAIIEKTAAPAQAEETLLEFAEKFKGIKVSDKELSAEVDSWIAQKTEFNNSAAGLINKTIDACMFHGNEYKQESHANVLSFAGKTAAQIRTALQNIKKLYYTPANSTLYISGNITDTAALALTEKYFGAANEIFARNPDNQSLTNSDKKKHTIKKYVIAHPELSPELTQVVMQLDNLSQDEADLLAAIYNNPESAFKKQILKQKNLAIRAPDYIDISSAQQSNSSRLIIQTLCEKTKVNPATQGDLFLEMATKKKRVTEEERAFILKKLNSGFNAITDNSTLLMKNLAVFNQTNKESAETLFNKNKRLEQLTTDYLNDRYESAEGAVFVLCNEERYYANKKAFDKAGYNAVIRSFPEKSTATAARDTSTRTNEAMELADSAKRFIEENKAQFSEFSLNNGIPVTVKHTPGSKTAAISLAIEGGELLFADKDAGLSSILVNSLASIIQWQLDSLLDTGVLKNDATVTAWTGSQYSVLTISCSTEDAAACIERIAASIIFGDITPALADGISYDLRTQWRIKTGAPDFQLLCEAVRTIYSKPFTNLYADTKDKPVQMEFTDIAAAYPIILDCSRFGLVITGGIEESDNLHGLLENTFGTLGSVKATESIKRKVEKKNLPSKTKKIQLRHQFFTDISKDKAGPRPAVLIPTTDFSDPLLYVLESPDIASTDCALFDALLYELQYRMQKKVSSEQTVKIDSPDSDLPYGRITVTKIKHTSQTDSIYTKCVKELISDLEMLIARDKERNIIDLEKSPLLARLENQWLLRELEKTSDNAGTAMLIQKGKAQGNGQLYLDMYKSISQATAEDFYLVAKVYLPETPALKIYSVDSKN